MGEAWLPDDIDPEVCHRRAGMSIDEILTRLADAQHGMVEVAQLARLGVSEDQLLTRVRRGQLHRVARGLYLVGRRRQDEAARRIGEVLRCGPGAHLAGRSTLAACALVAEDIARPVDIAIPAARRIRRPGVVRVWVGGPERTTVDGVPSMTVPRALLHLAVTDGAAEVQAAWREAAYRRRLHLPAVARVLHDHRGEPGTAILRDCHDERIRLIGATANEFEDRMLAIIREVGMPEPRCNRPLWIDEVRLRPDFYVVERGLVIESDGRGAHDDPERRQEDARRDALYRSIGLAVMRQSWWSVTHERARVVADLMAYEAGWVARRGRLAA